MSASHPEERLERKVVVGEWMVHLVSYRLGADWFCTADNVDPGANLARAKASNRAAAEEEALSAASALILRTRRLR